jgi:hypothetical protein
MCRFPRAARSFLGLCLVSAILFSARPAMGRPGPDDIGLTELEGEVKTHNQTLHKLMRGEMRADSKDKAHVDAIDFQSRWITFRFNYTQFHKPASGLTVPVSKTIEGLHRDFDGDMTSLLRIRDKDKDTFQAIAQLYTLKVLENGKQVLDTNKPIAQINAARVMAGLARLGQPELAAGLTDLIREPRYNDAIKYWAFKGLRDLMAITPPVLKKDAETKPAEALVEFLGQKRPISPITPVEEIEGYRMLRREAIRALAQNRLPTLPNKANPPVVLLKLMANDGIAPEARIDERMEAAIGLARTEAQKDKDFQIDYALQQIALFLNDYVAFIKDNNKDDQRPIKVYAARLSDALELLRAESKDPENLKYFAKVVDDKQGGIKWLLEQIVLKGAQADAQNLVQLIEANPPKNKELFKGNPATAVKPPMAAKEG